MSEPGKSLVRRVSDRELMPPPPPTKRIKRPPRVLDEDTYTDALSKIIARDFFPGLLEAKYQQEYLDALDSQDGQWIAAARNKLAQVMTPGGMSTTTSTMGTPTTTTTTRSRRGTSFQQASLPPLRPGMGDTPVGAAGETPMSVMSGMSRGSVGSATTTTTTTTTATAAAAKRAAQQVDLGMSLGNFQAKYTSEDNESFNKLLDKQNNKRAARYAWLWAGNRIPSSRLLMERERERKQQLQQQQQRQQLLLPQQRQPEQGQVGASQELQQQQQKQQQELEPEQEQKQQPRLIEGGDERPAMPDTWNAKPGNELFFTPDGVEDELETVQQSSEARSRAPPKAVVHENTRMPPPPSLLSPLDPAVPPPSPSLSAINDAIAGRPRPSASEAGAASVAGGGGGSSTPRVNGYSFVDEEPTIAELRQARLQQLNANASSSSSSAAFSFSSSSFAFASGAGGAGGGGPPANPFKIGEQSRREALHHRMVDRVAQKNRAVSRAPSVSPAGAAGAGPLGTPSSPFARTPVRGGAGAGGVGNLTPAAQRLWSRIGTPAAAGGAATPFDATARANKTPLDIRWTPVPKAVAAAAAKKVDKEP